MTPRPPRYAQALVEALVPAAQRDSIVGDLLEEYHESQLPAHGRRKARRWVVLRAFGFLWSASALPGLGIAGVLTIRAVVDVGSWSNDLASRAWATTLAIIGVFLVAGFRLGRSTGQVKGAVAMAICASLIGTMYAEAIVVVGMAAAATVVHASPAAWNGLREGLDIPAPVIAIIGVAFASAGAAAGRLFTGSTGSRASLRT